jgi:hypothetical protein
MIKDDEINAIYDNRPTGERLYANQLKKNYIHKALFKLSTLHLSNDSKGNRNKSLVVNVDCKDIATEEDHRFLNGNTLLVFPKKAAGYMFANSSIDIRQDENDYLIQFKRISQRNYEIIKHERQEDIF